MTNSKKITYTVIQKIQARELVNNLDDDALAFMVYHVLNEHRNEFIQYLQKLGGEKK